MPKWRLFVGFCIFKRSKTFNLFEGCQKIQYKTTKIERISIWNQASNYYYQYFYLVIKNKSRRFFWIIFVKIFILTFSNLIYIRCLTLDCHNLENGNWFTKILIINYYKNDPKKSSRFNLYYKMLNQMCSNWRQNLQSKK